MPSQAVATIRYAMRGVGFLLEARNVKVLLALTLLALAIAAYLSVSVLEWSALIVALTGVWVAEALNSALERLTDLASPQFHPLAGKAKDLAAGAVLLASIGAISTAAVIFGARLI